MGAVAKMSGRDAEEGRSERGRKWLYGPSPDGEHPWEDPCQTGAIWKPFPFQHTSFDRHHRRFLKCKFLSSTDILFLFLFCLHFNFLPISRRAQVYLYREGGCRTGAVTVLNPKTGIRTRPR